jgi:uncharacterized RDD family membrane protein YckC
VSTYAEVDESLIGHYAGAVTRLTAFVIDMGIALTLFNVTAAASVWLVNWLTNLDVNSAHQSWWRILLLVGWLFVYFWYCLSLAGRTPGMAFIGLRVVRGTGEDVTSARFALRVLVSPLSFAFFGIGLLGIVFGRHRRALHDVIADTAVVYDFDARAAHLRFLHRKPPVKSDT